MTITASATAIGLDRERSFYPAMMIAIATYYILFAAISGSVSVVIGESLAAAVFLVFTAIGFKTSLWFVVAALAGHGVFDVFHHLIIDDPGVPRFWPGFCAAFDIVAAAYLAVLLTKRPGLARTGSFESSVN